MQIVMNKKAENLYSSAVPVKMKIFSGSDFIQAESEINDWLSKHSVRVEQICQSQCERNGKLLLLVSIFYTPLRD
jgi:hypothetical protein